MPGFKQLRNKSAAAVLVELSDDVYRHLTDPSLRSRHTFFVFCVGNNDAKLIFCIKNIEAKLFFVLETN